MRGLGSGRLAGVVLAAAAAAGARVVEVGEDVMRKESRSEPLEPAREPRRRVPAPPTQASRHHEHKREVARRIRQQARDRLRQQERHPMGVNCGLSRRGRLVQH